jgi:hypothetical protein
MKLPENLPQEDMHGKEMPDDPPPFLGTWRNVYIFVLTYLVCVITLFYIFTRVMA